MRTVLMLMMGVSLAVADGLAANPQDPSEQLRQIERERLRSLVVGDLDVARRLHAEDFQLINPNGLPWSKDQYLGRLESGEFEYRVWEPEGEIQVRHYGDAAVIRYAAHLEILVGGQERSLRAWHIDLYERRDGEWQVVWSQATERQPSGP
ncbi:MAG: nuclear transport factor 2 family protein [Longimicrobiales bacterium]